MADDQRQLNFNLLKDRIEQAHAKLDEVLALLRGGASRPATPARGPDRPAAPRGEGAGEGKPWDFRPIDQGKTLFAFVTHFDPEFGLYQKALAWSRDHDVRGKFVIWPAAAVRDCYRVLYREVAHLDPEGTGDPDRAPAEPPRRGPGGGGGAPRRGGSYPPPPPRARDEPGADEDEEIPF